MRSVLKYLKINRDYVFSGHQDDLVMILKKSSGINIKRIGDNEIKLYPNISFGTLIMRGGLKSPGGIHVKATLSNLESGRLKVNLRTEVRKEHYFMIGIFVFFFALADYGDSPISMILYLLGLWIVFHVWFQFIYRVQENYLIGKVVDKLNLSEM